MTLERDLPHAAGTAVTALAAVGAAVRATVGRPGGVRSGLDSAAGAATLLATAALGARTHGRDTSWPWT